MSIFSRKSEPQPSTALVPAPPPPLKPDDLARAAPKAGDLERSIRRELPMHMSPSLAHAAGLSLAELIDFSTGALRLSTPQIEALARRMGLLEDLPPTGIDIVRNHLRVTMKKYGPTFVTHFEWRGSVQALQDFLDGGSLTWQEIDFLAKALIGKDVSIDPQTAEIRRPPVVVTTLSTLTHEPWSQGSNVPWVNAMALAHTRAKLRELEALVEAQG